MRSEKMFSTCSLLNKQDIICLAGENSKKKKCQENKHSVEDLPINTFTKVKKKKKMRMQNKKLIKGFNIVELGAREKSSNFPFAYYKPLGDDPFNILTLW